MLDATQIDKIIKDYVEAIKPYSDGRYRQKDKGEKCPEFWPGYRLAVKQREQLRVHIESDVFPTHLFEAKAPNMTDAEHAYLKETFKQVTLPEYVDFQNTILRALHESNWSLQPGESAGDETDPDSFAYFIAREIEHFGSLAEYFKHIITKIKTLDPMGVLCVMPLAIPTVESTGEEGETIMVMDPNERVKPQPIYFDVNSVVGKHDGQWYLLRTREKSVVTDGGESKRTGEVLWLVDDTNCWKIEQYGKKHELNFRPVLYFQHDTGYVPCEALKGTPVLREGTVAYESPYLPAKDLLDLVLIDSSQINIVKASSIYPQKVMLGNDCEYEDVGRGARCSGGHLHGIDADGLFKDYGECPSCKGSGMTVQLGPNKVLLVRQQSKVADSGQAKVQDAMAIVEPGGQTLDKLQTQVDKNRAAARKMLHLHSETPIAGGDAATATEVGVGVKAQNAFIAPIASQTFALMDFVLGTIAQQRYGTSEGFYTLIPATQFELRTEADYIALLGEAQSKNLPPAAIEEILRGYFATRHGSDPYMAEAFQVLAYADVLLTAGWQQVEAMQAKGNAKEWEVQLHRRALTMYDELMQTPEFRALSVMEKADRIKEYARGKFLPSTALPANPSPAQRAAQLVDGIVSEMTVVQDTAVPAGETVQDTALNGAQVASLLEIIIKINTGIITIETARPLIRAAFPGIDDATIKDMLAGVKQVDPNLVATVN